MSSVRAVEFRLQAEENGDLELRRSIPTVRFLRNRGVIVTVWSSKKTKAAYDFHPRGRLKSPKWYSISDLFHEPSSADKDLAADHAAHGDDCYLELTHSCRGFMPQQGDSCSHG